jgi:hypothetical protein
MLDLHAEPSTLSSHAMRILTWVLLIAMLCGFAVPVADADETGATPLTIQSKSHASPATLAFKEKFRVSIKYINPGPHQVWIFARPMTDGKGTPNVRAHRSYRYNPGEGEVEGWFYFESETSVDELLLTMEDQQTGETIARLIVPVDLKWR